MSVSGKVKALLIFNNKKAQELAEPLGISPQGVRNKFARDSFSAEDLIKIATALDSELTFITKKGVKVSLDSEDIRLKD